MFLQKFDFLAPIVTVCCFPISFLFMMTRKENSKLLQWMDFLVPIVSECFFPIIENKPRRFKWPGLSQAVWTLLVETVYVSCALVVLISMTMFEGFLLISGYLHETVIPSLPPASDEKKGRSLTVTTLDASKGEATPSVIKGFVARSEPVIIKNIAKDTFSSLAPNGEYSPPLSKEELERGTLNMNFFPYPRNLGAFGEWIKEFVSKMPIMYMARFSGSYKSGYAHIDSFGTYNVYYVARGKKNVWILPRQYNHLLKFTRGYNAAFLAGSDGVTPEAFWWKKVVPGVWEFDLVAGDVMIFNNTACLHKFVNATKDPMIFTTRLLNFDFSPILAKSDCFNWDQARFAIDMLLSNAKTVKHPNGAKGITRDTGFKDVAGQSQQVEQSTMGMK